MTMKSYTDIEQSKVLAEILPAESADVCYGINDDTLKYNDLPWLIPYHKYTAKEFYIPCWSLSALFDAMPPIQELCSSTDHYYRVHCMNLFSEWHENAIDSCVEMIIKLHKKGLI